jgi:chromosomal replication initiation ATPase DnaA
LNDFIPVPYARSRRYSDEERRLWEDLRHGFILGTEQFVESIKNRFLPGTPHREIPQQKLLIKGLDLDKILKKASAFLGCDVEDFKKAARVSTNRVLDRDLLLYVVWQLGVRTNSQIGEIFGLSGSAVSQRVGVLKSKAKKDKSVRKIMAEIKSIIEI